MWIDSTLARGMSSTATRGTWGLQGFVELPSFSPRTPQHPTRQGIMVLGGRGAFSGPRRRNGLLGQVGNKISCPPCAVAVVHPHGPSMTVSCLAVPCPCTFVTIAVASSLAAPHELSHFEGRKQGPEHIQRRGTQQDTATAEYTLVSTVQTGLTTITSLNCVSLHKKQATSASWR